MTEAVRRHMRRLRYLAVFLLGVWAGGAGFLFWHGQQLEQLMLENRNLSLVNDRLREDIADLKQSQKAVKKSQQTEIEEIRVTVLDPKPDAFTEAEVIHRLQRDLDPVKGKRVEQVAEVHPLLHEMLKRREYVVEGKIAEVRLKTVFISRVLQLFVAVTVKNPSP